MDHILHEYAQVAVVLHQSIAAAGGTRSGSVQIRARLALHTDPQTSLFGIVNGNVEGQLLAGVPAVAAGWQAVLWV